MSLCFLLFCFFILLFLDFLITVWIAGMLVQEAKEAYQQGKERYLSQYWNSIDLYMLGFFVISGVFLAHWLFHECSATERLGDTR